MTGTRRNVNLNKAKGLNIMVAQLNPQVGAITANSNAILQAAHKAREAGAHVLLTEEQSLNGYPLLDLAKRADFVAYSYRKALELAAKLPKEIYVIFGGLEPSHIMGRHGQIAYNVAFVAYGGKIIAVSRKGILPIGGEFDEPRIFLTGEAVVVEMFGVKVGIPICEDIWHADVCVDLEARGAKALLVPNGSPSYLMKSTVRHDIALQRVKETGIPLVYCNMVGGQDMFLFDGGSFGMNPGNKEPCLIMPYWKEAVTMMRLVPNGVGGYRIVDGEKAVATRLEHTARGAELGLRDYLRKTGAGRNGVIFGLSGGIDSGLALPIAVKALGPEKVRCVRLPTPHTSPESMILAEQEAKNFGIRLDTIDIWPVYLAMQGAIEAGMGEPLNADLAMQNAQSRIRSNILWNLANQHNLLVLGTGNWSETSQGYMTVGGDAVSGLNVLRGLSKTLVFELCHWYNQEVGYEMIPERIITRPPSAELKKGQQDTDSLPDYITQLDPVLERYVSQNRSVREIVADGFDEVMVRGVVSRLYGSQFKRTGSLGLNILAGSYDRKWDMPIACHKEAYELDAYQATADELMAA